MTQPVPTILTNMVFWQSPLWQARTRSIFVPGDTNDGSAWKQAWTLLRRRREADVVVTMGIRPSMAYAALCALLRRPPKQIMMEVFIDSAQPDSWRWRWKTAIYGYLARRATGLITNSRREVETTAARYRVPHARLRFVPLCATLLPETVPARTPAYIVSAGRTLRDYPAMLELAKARPDWAVKIICGHNDLKQVVLPDNVTLYREVDRTTYLDILGGATVVCLPLRPTERATGQVVMLEAMAMGKPVVTTSSPGTVDYIRHGETGYLTNPGSMADLIQACEGLLNNPSRRETMGAAAQTYIRTAAAPDHYAKSALAAIAALTANE